MQSYISHTWAMRFRRSQPLTHCPTLPLYEPVRILYAELHHSYPDDDIPPPAMRPVAGGDDFAAESATVAPLTAAGDAPGSPRVCSVDRIRVQRSHSDYMITVAALKSSSEPKSISPFSAVAAGGTAAGAAGGGEEGDDKDVSLADVDTSNVEIEVKAAAAVAVAAVVAAVVVGIYMSSNLIDLALRRWPQVSVCRSVLAEAVDWILHHPIAC